MLIVSNKTHSDNSHSVWNERKMPFEVSVSPVLMKNPGDPAIRDQRLRDHNITENTITD